VHEPERRSHRIGKDGYFRNNTRTSSLYGEQIQAAILSCAPKFGFRPSTQQPSPVAEPNPYLESVHL